MASESEAKNKHLTLRLTESEHRKIKVFAAEEGITIKDLVLGCIDRLMEERRGQKDESQKKD
jgi:predicted DNA binding CopG/RHH family protein